MVDRGAIARTGIGRAGSAAMTESGVSVAEWLAQTQRQAVAASDQGGQRTTC
jgi:hypothetical protein